MGIEAGASTSPTTKLPAPLTESEKAWSAVLVIIGFILIVGVLVWFAASTGDGKLKSKETTVTEPAGQTATGTKTTTTTEYADTIVIFALTAGTGFLLAGAFYGRLRELKLGALTLGLGELPPQKQQELDKHIEDAVSDKVPDPQQREVVKAAARSFALDQIKKQYWGVVPSPPEDTIKQLATTASQRVLNTLPSGDAPRSGG
jgi:hypothetical protein